MSSVNCYVLYKKNENGDAKSGLQWKEIENVHLLISKTCTLYFAQITLTLLVCNSDAERGFIMISMLTIQFKFLQKRK